ncbi:hypothetical protein GOODEAATRI_018717 [Goodea atripinnis]|uniref:NAD(+) diphosphatase n=1 Tax=Goodea atripinnis TaxID=208336 RepID=A0ABV0NLD3_9TELE
MTSLQLSAKEEMVEKFLDTAARGDLSQVSTLLSHAPSLINETGYSGWTALMLAARNGHHHVVEKLLSLGCDKFTVNSSSQTAYDIAKFWGHRHIANLLSRSADGCRRILPAADLSPQENYFGRETLDRLSRKRTDKVWLETKQSDSDTIYLLFSNLSPMVSTSQEDNSEEVQPWELSLLGLFSVKAAAAMPAVVVSLTHVSMRYEDVRDLLQKASTVMIFLGMEKMKNPSSSTSSQTVESISEPPVWFAINTDEDAAALLKRCRGKNCLFPRSPNRDLLKLNEEEADPVVIMLVIHPDENQCLLGRKKVFPAGMFSCLAGFIEPGETMEEAVRREVEEESGVKVGPVQYVSCQPWPMPSNLMIGCLAVAISTDIKVDENEIEEARWFPRQQVNN